MADKDRELEKEYWKTMPLRKKLRHFAEYYLPTVIVLGIIASFAVYLLVTIFGPHQKSVMSAVFIDGYLDKAAKKEMKEELRELFGCESKYETVSLEDGLFQANSRHMMKLSVQYAAGDLDLLVGPPGEIEILEQQGALKPVKGYLPDLFPDAADDMYGVPLTGAARFEALKTGIPDAEAALLNGAKNGENAVQFIRYLLEE